MAPHKPHVIGFQSDLPQTPSLEGFGRRRVRSGKTPVAHENLEEKTQRLLKEDRQALMLRLAKAVGFLYLPKIEAKVSSTATASRLPPDFIMNHAEILSGDAYNSLPKDELGAGVISLDDKQSGVRFFPAFQWKDGHFHPHITPVVRALRRPPLALSDWQIFAWFASVNGWLNDDTPMERLDDLEALLEVVTQEQYEMGA